MNLLEGIYSRRSIRHFTAEPVEREMLMEIIKAGSWAPSGLNNQPWRFAIVTDGQLREALASLTKYSRIIQEAPACVAVFLDQESMYHEGKDMQAAGACIQNMLLAAHALGLGAVWLGEILNNADKAREALSLAESLQLMAVVAIGHKASQERGSNRRPLDELIVLDS